MMSRASEPDVSTELAARERPQLPRASAIVVAAGHSTRMRGANKLFAPLDGQPLLYHTLAAFQECQLIDHIALVLALDSAELGLAMLKQARFTKVDATCAGGERRQDSVRAGLEALRACDWVVVHDGARPLVTADLIEAGIEAAQETGAASAALPVVDTLKEAASDGTVLWTVARDNLWTVQTPQVFRFSLLSAAHERDDLEASDDAGLVERLGGRVQLFPGLASNLKVTIAEDLLVAESLLRARRLRGLNLGAVSVRTSAAAPLPENRRRRGRPPAE